MNNPEFEPEIIDDIDVSGYSEKRTDLKIDKKDDGQQGVKQFNRLTQNKPGLRNAGTFIPKKQIKKKFSKIEEQTVFESK